MVITLEIKSGDLEFDSQPRPWICHLLQWVSVSVPDDLYIYSDDKRRVSDYLYIYKQSRMKEDIANHTILQQDSRIHRVRL